jgi:hypothetical protein
MTAEYDHSHRKISWGIFSDGGERVELPTIVAELKTTSQIADATVG